MLNIYDYGLKPEQIRAMNLINPLRTLVNVVDILVGSQTISSLMHINRLNYLALCGTLRQHFVHWSSRI